MRRRERVASVLTAALLTVLTLSCGVSPQSRPVPLPVQVRPTPTSAQTGQNGYAVTVYFVQFGRLAPVSRAAPDTSVATALRLLVDGPDSVEAALGLETALVPQGLSISSGGQKPLTVDVGPEFTSIAGDNQLLAMAQLVWTVTESAPRDLVRISVDNQPIEVTTDDGLSRLPVGREDYASVAQVVQPSSPSMLTLDPTASPS